jgi:aspartate racemase
MRRIGLIGGTSWVSTAEYYRTINQLVNQRLGGTEYARLTLDSLNFGDLLSNRDAGNAEANQEILVGAARRLAAADVEGIVICANTLHMYSGAIESATGLPIIHIAHATAEAVRQAHVQRVALIGTRITMESGSYAAILATRGIDCLIPCESDRAMIEESIFGELARDIFTAEMRDNYLAVIDRLTEEGAEAVILGCTEIPLLLEGSQTPIPSFDTTRIHASAAVDFMLHADGDSSRSECLTG